MPESLAAKGTVTLTPAQSIRRVIENPSMFVTQGPTVLKLNENGQIVDAQNSVGVWMVTGIYKVSFQVGGVTIQPFEIEVRETHTIEDPLDLAEVAPYTPPPDTPSRTGEPTTKKGSKWVPVTQN